MEAQPPPQPTPPPLSSVLPPPPPHLSYPDSVDSSPRSRNTDSWDEPYPSTTTTTTNASKLRLMVSYGGHIVPRPHDKTLTYVGGDTRIIVMDRHTSLSDLSTRLSRIFLNGLPFSLKYQLPNEDLDSLISVATDEDLDIMIEEFDQRASNSSSKSCRIRLFLFPTKPDSVGSGKSEDWFLSALNGSGLMDGGLSDSSSVNYLLGLDDEAAAAAAGNNSSNPVSGSGDGAVTAQGGDGKSLKQGQVQGQDVHSVPDSPMLETNSSFGSTSSSPSVANLPPVKVHGEDGGSTGGGGVVRGQDQKVVGIEEQFAQLGVGGVGLKQDEGFVVLSSSSPPPPVAVNVTAPTSVPVSSAAGEYHWVVSDDERSDHGVPFGYSKPPTSQPQSQTQTQTQTQTHTQTQAQAQPQAQALPPQFQQKSTGVVDLPSPDSVSSDSSFSNAMSRPKPVNVMYQDQVQFQSGASQVTSASVDPKLNVCDPHGRTQLQQLVPDPGYVLQHPVDQQQQLVPDPGYVLQHPFDQQQQQPQFQHPFDHQQQQPQLQHPFDQQQQQPQLQHPFDHQQQQPQLQHPFDQQQQQPQQVQQPQQFMHGTHFIHHTPAGPVQAYYTVYPSQQQLHPQHHHQLDQQYQVYYVPARQAQAYNLSVPQASIGDFATTIPSSRPQNAPNPTAMIPPSAAYNLMRNAPLPKSEMTGGAYRMAAASTPQLVQVPASQHQQQYRAYSQIHHPSQSMAPSSAAPANYAYDYADPAHAQMFYAQHLAPTMPSQYQTMTATGAVLQEVPAQFPPDSMKQQVRTSQPL